MIYWHKSNTLDRIIALCSVIYTFASFGLTGIPVVSRISLIAALVIAALLTIRKQALFLPPWILLITITYLYLIIPALSAPAPDWEAISVTASVLVGTVCLGLVLVNRIIDHKLAVYSMLSAAIVNIFAVLMGVDTGTVYYGQIIEGRATGLLGNSNTLAVNMMLPALVVLLVPKQFSRLSLWIAFFTAFFGLVVSGSRKAIILGITLFLMVGKRLTLNLSRLKQAYIFSLTLLILVISYTRISDILNIFSDNIFAVSRVFQIFSGEEVSYSLREQMIDKGYNLWMDSPIVGHGLSEYSKLSGFGTYSHNNIIELLVSGGIIALFLYYTLYVLTIYKAYKNRPKDIFYSWLIVITMLIIDTANVTFLSKSNMLFVVYVISFYSLKDNDYAADQPSNSMQSNSI